MERRRRRVQDDNALEGKWEGTRGTEARGDKNAHACDANATQNRQEQETKLHEYDARPTGTGCTTTLMRHKTDKNPTHNDTNATLIRHH